MKCSRTTLIALGILFAPGLALAQGATAETSTHVVTDDAVLPEAVIDEVAEEVAEESATEDTAADDTTEVPEATAPDSSADDFTATTDAPVEEAPAGLPSTVPEAATDASTTATSPEVPAPAEQPVPVDTTGWSYTPRNVEVDVPTDVSLNAVPAESPSTSSSLSGGLSPAELYPNYVRLHLSGAQQFSTGNDLASVSEGRSMGMGTFGIGARVARHVSVDVNYVSGTTTDSAFADTTATFRSTGADARVRFDYALFRFFRVYGAVGLGARSAHIEVSTQTDDVTQSRIGFAGSVSAGVELAYIGRRFGVGVFYEGGYALQTPYDFNNARFEGSDNAGVDLGSIFLHGATHGGGLFVAAYF